MSLISVHWSEGSLFIRVKIRNSTTGQGLTGLTNASANLRIAVTADSEPTSTSYTGANIETVAALGTYQAPTVGKVRFKERDATAHPGTYEIHIADTRVSVLGAKSLEVTVSGAVTNMAESDAIIPLLGLDLYDHVLDSLVDKLVALGTANISITSPVSVSGQVEVVIGDDYLLTDGRQLDFANTAGTWPDLTGATVLWTAKSTYNTVTKAGTVVVPTGVSQKVRVELTSTDTLQFRHGYPYKYELQVTLANGHTVTLAALAKNTVIVLGH